MYSPKEYWAALADRYDSADSTGFAPVLHPQSPQWFNNAIDRIQFRAVRRAVAVAKAKPGARFLDVGCGTGRWVRRYREMGFRPVGLDATMGMLLIARSHRTTTPLTAGLANSLPFAKNAFDCLSDITVVQHIPYELQPQALREMIRVLKPGGTLILFELTKGGGEGGHVFPRPPKDWIGATESCGARLIGCFGQEYFFFDRLFVNLAQRATGRRGNAASQVQAVSENLPAPDNSFSRRLYWKIRQAVVPFSVLIEPVLGRIAPLSSATHGVFVFQKNL